MVAEDDTNTRKLMCTVLKQNGYEPVPAVDGIDALDILDRQHVDLILLDVMMPRMDGYEFVKTLREGGCNTPVLMVTARETSADKIAGFRAGTDDYMVKPVDDEEMLLRISALLRRSNIANEHKLHAGNTVLDYECAYSYLRRRHPRASQQGVYAAVQIAQLSEQNIHTPSAYGRAVGYGNRNR